ncbi:m(7)G2069 methylase of 23S rRNA [Petrocella atlantisensis]|uniref:M(7)G2069 methylase of 23S rRNA n=1 Tax=Petrocella atlantisensis TaxID=2173034 RepID=A0A3P7P1P2_9FIRM|nr:class I SAM-dependent RNA methyltransferase [Petrocella atlantisensis]MCF8019247.1 class I SAM-dependent RNA methyltransferase [Vallitaleaceae bacterium]VDN47410.1 m(7)G2069 methylase of 23S rRNA [Petrocella atlantisensis]
MSSYRLLAPCLFGLESVLKQEIKDLGYEVLEVEDGRVIFEGDALAISRSNIWLRTAERVMIEVDRFEAKTFEELFEKIQAIAWETYIPLDGKFWVSKASSIKSELFSSKDIQSIVKKAMVKRLGQFYKETWFEESGASYPVRIFIKKDMVSVCLDTSLEALHKRGYRIMTSKAPLSETLAAALILLSVWNKDRAFVDPFCGSGTLVIEAAMIGANLAPGLNRSFAAEGWKNLVPKDLWMAAVDEANKKFDPNASLNIQGFDIDGDILKVARENAVNAGVEGFIHFQERDVKDLTHKRRYGVIVTNPPYGERLSNTSEVEALYKVMGQSFTSLEDWSYYILTSFEGFEKHFGQKAQKKRKLYNGMLKTNLYQYLGKRPPKIERADG